VHREEERRWRAEDMEQRALDNALKLWERYVEKNRRDVEERAEQLKGISNLAALIAGFAMVAFLQFQFLPTDAPQFVFVLFGITTASTVRGKRSGF
jgi:calcium release-activated calcium channel protein 1